MTKELIKKTKKPEMTIEEATTYLKSVDEWHSSKVFDSQTIIKWATFLKNYLEKKSITK